MRSASYPIHKELGMQAFAMLRDTGSAGEVLLTQWSAVLGTGLASQEHVRQTRAIATLAEKGDDKLWDQLLGKRSGTLVA